MIIAQDRQVSSQIVTLAYNSSALLLPNIISFVNMVFIHSCISSVPTTLTWSTIIPKHISSSLLRCFTALYGSTVKNRKKTFCAKWKIKIRLNLSWLFAARKDRGNGSVQRKLAPIESILIHEVDQVRFRWSNQTHRQ